MIHPDEACTGASMNRLHSKFCVVSVQLKSLLFLILIVAGLAGNYFRYQAFFNIDFLFGSIFAMLALQFFGLGRGVLAAALISSCTYFIWNHPYAIIIQTAEVAVVGWLMYRRKTGMVLADTLFWLLIGMPLVYLFYHVAMHLSLNNVSIIMMKQAVNGIANALAARMIFITYSHRSRSALISYREIVFCLLTFFVLCPVLALLAVDSRSDFASTDDHIKSLLLQNLQRETSMLETWVANRKTAIINLASMAASRSPRQMQPYLEEATKSDINFQRVGLYDVSATTTAFFPLTDELGHSNIGKNFADRPFIPRLKQTLKPILSEVVLGKIGIPRPIVLVVAPVVIRAEYGGYVAGILSLEQVRRNLETSMNNSGTLYTLLDRNGTIIMSNRKDQKVMAHFERGKGELKPREKGIAQWIPELPPNTPASERWKTSLYVVENTVGNPAEWKLVLEQPVAPFQKSLNDSFTAKLTLLFLILLATQALAEFFSRNVVKSLERLSFITRELPEKLAQSGNTLVWPESGVEEAHQLIQNFRMMSDSLSQQFLTINRINETLEQRIEERTEKIRKSEDKHHSILRSAMDGYWQADMEGRLLEVNQAYCAMSGYTEQELLSMRISDLDMMVSPDYSDTRIRKIREHGEDRFESRHRRKDGTCFDVEVSVKYHSHDGGTSVAFLRDITSRKQAAEDLRQSENRFRIMVETIPLAIRLTAGEEQTTEFVNPAFVRLFGYTRDDIPDIDRWWLLAYPDAAYRREIVEVWNEKVIRASEPLIAIAPIETVVTCKDGSKKQVAWGLFAAGNKNYAYGVDLTVQKRVEDSLRTNEQRLKNIIDETPLGIHLYELGEGGSLVFCGANPAADRILGFDHSRLIGKTIEDAFPLLSKTSVPSKYRETALFGIVWRKEMLEYDDGDTRGVYEFTAFQTEPGRMATIFDDVTHRKQAEEALVESEKRYRLLADNVSDVIWTMDLDGRFTYFSPSIEKLRGFTPDEALQLSLEETLTPDSLKIAAEILENARTKVQAGLPVVFLGELEEYVKYGSTIRTEVSASAVYASDGTFGGFLGVTRDITIRKRQEDALRKSEYEFRMLAESMPQIVWICDAAGMNVYFNQKWVDYTGLTLEECYGTGWITPFHPEERQQALEAWSNATASGTVYSLECRLRRADGVYKWWLIRGEPVRNEQGSIEKWFGTCTDIDELKQSGEQLKLAIAAADTANKAKSRFLANMSHEIRTPMNAVIGLSRLLRDSQLNKTQQEYADLIVKSGNNMLRLINNILDLSRIEADRVELEDRPFDPREEVADILNLLSFQANEKGLELGASIDPALPFRVRGDAGCLRQILTNLIGNAIKFTPTGSVTLKVQIEHTDAKNALLRCSVTDSGIGLPADKLEHVFEPFAQADDSSTRRFGGTGLGLAICRQLVEMMGGEIGVESREGKGSTFWFTVQVGIATGDDVADHAGRIEGSGKIRPISYAGKNIRILLVEDDSINQLVTKNILRQAGASVDIANNGAEALRLLSENDYPLVLMDCQMPVMDGFEATAAIRNPVSPVRNHSVPVIALTATALNEDRKQCLAAGMDGFLSKPLDVDSLLELLSSWLPDARPVIFDEANLLKRHNDDPDVVRELAGLFVSKAPTYMAEIRERLSRGDLSDARLQAHKLKGSATTLGALRIASLATDLEVSAEAMRGGEASQILDNLTKEFECLLTLLVSRGWIVQC